MESNSDWGPEDDEGDPGGYWTSDEELQAGVPGEEQDPCADFCVACGEALRRNQSIIEVRTKTWGLGLRWTTLAGLVPDVPAGYVRLLPRSAQRGRGRRDVPHRVAARVREPATRRAHRGQLRGPLHRGGGRAPLPGLLFLLVGARRPSPRPTDRPHERTNARGAPRSERNEGRSPSPWPSSSRRRSDVSRSRDRAEVDDGAEVLDSDDALSE